MSEKNIKSRIIHKHDYESNWLKAVNFVPMQGELVIYDPDDMYFYSRFKIGDGISNINDLPFSDGSFGGPSSIDAGSIMVDVYDNIGIIDAESIV